MTFSSVYGRSRRACGLSESTLRREFAKNAALAEFVRKAPAYQPSRTAAPFGRTVEKGRDRVLGCHG
jgi:hypothetical protein